MGAYNGSFRSGSVCQHHNDSNPNINSFHILNITITTNILASGLIRTWEQPNLYLQIKIICIFFFLIFAFIFLVLLLSPRLYVKV